MILNSITEILWYGMIWRPEEVKIPWAPVLAGRPATKSIETPGSSQWSWAILKIRKTLEKKQSGELIKIVWTVFKAIRIESTCWRSWTLHGYHCIQVAFAKPLLVRLPLSHTNQSNSWVFENQVWPLIRFRLKQLKTQGRIHSKKRLKDAKKTFSEYVIISQWKFTKDVRSSVCYLGFVQKAKDNVVVGIGPHHNGMGGDTGHVAPAVLSDFSSRIVRTEQLKFTGRQVYRPRICVVAWK